MCLGIQITTLFPHMALKLLIASTLKLTAIQHTIHAISTSITVLMFSTADMRSGKCSLIGSLAVSYPILFACDKLSSCDDTNQR